MTVYGLIVRSAKLFYLSEFQLCHPRSEYKHSTNTTVWLERLNEGIDVKNLIYGLKFSAYSKFNYIIYNSYIYFEK